MNIKHIGATDSYELVESEPNEDGFYELPRSVHFTYPAMVAQNLLAEAGYVYVGAKKGNYDIELWAKEVATLTITEEAAFGQIRTDDLAASPPGVFDEVIPSLAVPVYFLIPTNQSCNYCGSRLDQAEYKFTGKQGSFKVCTLTLCINPLCNFHYVNVEKG